MNKNIILGITVLSLAFLSGCKLSNTDVSTPMNTFPNQYKAEHIMKDSINIGQLHWKSFFQDKQLVELIELALVKNNDLLTAFQNIEISKLQLRNSRWENIPQLQVDINSTTDYPSKNNLLNTTDQNKIDDFKLDFGMSWEADIWGKIKNQKKVALASYLQSEDAKNAIQTTLIAQIAQCYYNLIILEDQIAIAQKNIAISESTTHVVRLQFQAGKSTSLAVEQAEVQALQAKKLIPNLQLQILLQENILSTLTGDFPSVQQPRESLKSIEMLKTVQTGVPTILLSQRPDVKSAELGLVIANAEVGIAQAAFYPSLTLNANAGLQSFKISDWFNIPASLFGIVTTGISQPILQRRIIKTNYQISLADREKAVINFRAVVLNAVTEVSSALVQIDKQKEQQEILVKQSSILEHNISKAKILFSSGLANYLEILAAQNSLLNSEIEYNISKREELFARIELYRALGGGWQ